MSDMRTTIDGVRPMAKRYRAAVRAMNVTLERSRTALLAEIGEWRRALATVNDTGLLEPSGCPGWARLEVVVHVRAGLQELLACFTAGTALAPDRDAATYWLEFAPGGGGGTVEGTMWLRRTSSAYARPSGAVRHLADVLDQTEHALGGLQDATVRFQGHVLSTGDLIATWAVELHLHRLDLLVPYAEASDAAMLARETIEVLADGSAPAANLVAAERFLLIGSGRVEPTADERQALGGIAARLPVFG